VREVAAIPEEEVIMTCVAMVPRRQLPANAVRSDREPNGDFVRLCRVCGLRGRSDDTHEETAMIRDTVARFVDRELIPLEPHYLKSNCPAAVTRD